MGWRISTTSESNFDFNTSINSNLTLYAHWQYIPHEGDYTGYYEGITSSDTGLTLVNKLKNIISVVNAGGTNKNTNYEDTKTLLQVADLVPGSTTHVYGIYDSKSIPKEWDHVNNWNREHVWPQSLLGQDAEPTARNMATDAHNLRACTPSENSSRGNKYFDVSTTTKSYYPGDAHRGDVARILLYMAVRYNGVLSLVQKDPTTGQMANLTRLKDWHLADQVDGFEVNRNQKIYEVQKNRNPFIDHPELFEPVWNYFMQQAGLQRQAIELMKNTIASYESNAVRYVELDKRDN